MNITPDKEDAIFRPDGNKVLNAHEGNQIIAEIMSVIDWAQIIPTDDPNAPQMVEALQAMIWTREEGELLKTFTQVLGGKKVLAWSGTEYLYIDFKDISNDTQAFVEESALDEKIAAAIQGVLHFSGYVRDTEPPDAKEGDLWIVANAMPPTFPVEAQKMLAGEWVDVEYTPSIFDLWSLQADGHGYYWFGDAWNLLDFDVDLSQYYTKLETDALLATKQDKLTAGPGIIISAKNIISADITDTTQAPKALGEFFDSFSNLSTDNPTGILLENGPYYSDGSTRWPTFYNWLKNLHPELVVSKATYDDVLTSLGHVKKFVLDEVVGSIRFPIIRATAKSELIANANISGVDYELYSNGKLIMRGYAAATTSPQTITMPLEYANANYKPLVTPITGSTTTAEMVINTPTTLTVTSFSVRHTALSSPGGLYWETEGIASASVLNGILTKYASNKTIFHWVSVANSTIQTAVEIIPPANYTTPIPAGERIIIFGEKPVNDADGVGKIKMGATVSGATYLYMVNAFETDYQAGINASVVVAGITYTYKKGASGKGYVDQPTYNNLHNNLGSTLEMWARISADTYVAPNTDFSKVRVQIAEANGLTTSDNTVNSQTATSKNAGYRLFSNGDLEQFGETTWAYTGNSFFYKMPLDFKDTTYNILAQFIVTSNTDGGYVIYAVNSANKEIGRFMAYWSAPRYWRTVGKAASSVLNNFPKPSYYYQVGNTVQNAEIITASQALADIADLKSSKANISFDNIPNNAWANIYSALRLDIARSAFASFNNVTGNLSVGFGYAPFDGIISGANEGTGNTVFALWEYNPNTQLWYPLQYLRNSGFLQFSVLCKKGYGYAYTLAGALSQATYESSVNGVDFPIGSLAAGTVVVHAQYIPFMFAN